MYRHLSLLLPLALLFCGAFAQVTPGVGANGPKLANRSGLVKLVVPARKGRECSEVREDGQLDFDEEVVFRFDDYGEARLVSEAFGKLIPLVDERHRTAATGG